MQSQLVDWIDETSLVTGMGRDGLQNLQAVCGTGVEEKVVRAIPCEPMQVPSKEGFACKVIRWFARAGARYFVVEVHFDGELNREGLVGIAVRTPHLDTATHDWMTLSTLGALPREVQCCPVTYISSRTQNPPHVVYRYDRRGFDIPVYKASSIGDAELLLAHLASTGHGTDYSIARPYPTGSWSVIRESADSRRQVAQYTTRSSALSVACDMSLEVADNFHVVCRDQDPGKPVVIRGGRVVVRPE